MGSNPADLIARLTQRGGLESGGSGETNLSDARITRSMDLLDQILAYDVVENPATSLGQDAADAFSAEALEALRRLATDGPDAELSNRHQVGIEAVIETDGSKPSVLVQDGRVDPNNPRLRDWACDAEKHAAAIERSIAATGRLVVNGDLSENAVNGTVFMVAPGLAATAKHVVEQSFTPHTNPDGTTEWFAHFGDIITVDFHVEANRPARPKDRIEVTGVLWASPDLIGTDGLKLANLDLAILQLATDGPAALPLADDLPLDVSPALMHVVGHPRRGLALDFDLVREFEETMNLVFGAGFGVKRWSPGQLLIGPGQLAGDRTNARIMTHNASTLPGNSGAPVLDLNETADQIIGMHYGGFFKQANYAHGGKKFAAILRLAIDGEEANI